MSTEVMHLTALELELFVTARLEEERSSALERHCDTCEACARAVAREASLELTLRSMSADRRCGQRADAVPFEAAVPSAPKPRLYAFAAAAALAFVFAVVGRLPRAETHAPSVLLADAGDLAKAYAPSPAWAGGEPSGGTP